MNRLAAGRFAAAGMCLWGAAIWIQGGIRAMHKDKEREIWHKAEVETRDLKPDPEKVSADGISER